MRLKLSLSVALLSMSTFASAATQPAFVVGSGAGNLEAQVKLYGADLLELGTIEPYTGFRGGARVAVGDVNGDGAADIMTGPDQGGGPRVRVFNGSTGAAIYDFFAYDAQFTGGVYVGAGDLDGDGRSDLVTGAGAGGGPHVKVFSGRDGSTLASLFTFDSAFSGGVRVATGDFGGDGRADLIVAAGPGGGPHVKVLNGLTSTVQHEFFAFDAEFRGGVSLAIGRFAGLDALFVGKGEGGGEVKAFSLADGRLLADFSAFDPGYTGGVNLGFARIAGRDTLLVGMASGGGSLGLLNVSGRDTRDFTYLTPFGVDYMDGISVAGIAAVPEPASWALMISGFALTGAGLRRRTRLAAM
jgi:hypothetical protein